ncbi:MAG: ribosome recycling factor [Pseudomonadota bacterium]
MEQEVFNSAKTKMDKVLDGLRHELGKIRTGRASLSILEDVKVDYYGATTPINQLATLSVPDPRLIVIQPWDTKAIPDIERAIMKAQIGINPTSDGKVVRLPIPPLNEERRLDIVKQMKHKAEGAKVHIRSVRRDSNEHLKTLKKDSSITEDEEKKGHDMIQKLTDEYVTKVDDTVSHKEKDVMEV